MNRSGASSTEFSDSQTFKAAEGLLPEPTNFFAYIDTALVYSRLDASLRPILLMAAAFMPAVAGSIYAGKLPSPEVITKHLSPIISSQRYDHDGFRAKSIRPNTLGQDSISVDVNGRPRRAGAEKN